MTLHLKDITYAYERRRPVLREVTVTFDHGIHVILGPNGSGKSTLMRLMLGVMPADTGSIELNGTPIGTVRPARRADQLAYVPQRSAPSVAFTVRDILAMSRFGQRADTGTLDDIIRAFDLELLADSVFSELSIGQQQDVTFARALAQLTRRGCSEPRHLLADEPFSALDPAHVARCANRLQQVMEGDSGIAAILILHDFVLARRLASSITLLNGDGQVACNGTPEEVLRPEILAPVFRTDFMRLSGPDLDYLIPAIKESPGP